MKVDVKIDIKGITDRVLDEKARLFLSNTAFKLMDDYVPMDTGTLAQTVEVTPEYVHYKAPYAEKVYEGVEFNFSHEKHPLATAKWYDAMMEAREKKLLQTMQNYFDKK